ncbi:MAG: hypothetical protein JSV62_11845 [Promethearchaeota archaeon]|nr:MAG: hypothetical protein JSV62_11845 [Candidatus Lokiarchaeota archaeon]
MKEKNNKHQYLSIKELFSEILLRDILLFIFLFVLVVIQRWNNILPLLFPLVNFIFSIFFRILSTNRRRTEFKNSIILYNPLGLEKKHANRLFFCAIFQLILIFWLGAESLYNPHIVHWYAMFFFGILIFIYTFSFFWIFIDLWKYSKIEILKKDQGDNLTQDFKSQFASDLNNLISFLNPKNFKLVSFTSLSVFIGLNILDIILIFSIGLDSFSIELTLPGYQIITLSCMLYGFLIISPSLTILLLIYIYKAVNNFRVDTIYELIKTFPRNIQIKIIENVKVLNNKIKEHLKSE